MICISRRIAHESGSRVHTHTHTQRPSRVKLKTGLAPLVGPGCCCVATSDWRAVKGLGRAKGEEGGRRKNKSLTRTSEKGARAKLEGCLLFARPRSRWAALSPPLARRPPRVVLGRARCTRVDCRQLAPACTCEHESSLVCVSVFVGCFGSIGSFEAPSHDDFWSRCAGECF